MLYNLVFLDLHYLWFALFFPCHVRSLGCFLLRVELQDWLHTLFISYWLSVGVIPCPLFLKLGRNAPPPHHSLPQGLLLFLVSLALGLTAF